MPYSTYIFDVDGTLLDTSEGILASVRYVLDAEGYSSFDEATLRSFIGPPIQDSFARVFGLEVETANRLADLFRSYYKDEALLLARPYDGIYQVCDGIVERNKVFAAATYKRQDYATAILEHFGFGKYGSALHGSDFEGKLKKTDIIEKCLHDLKVEDRSTVLMIGDSTHDAEGARLAGIDFLAVTYGFGFGSREEVLASKAIGAVAAPIDILTYIQ